MRIRVVSGPQVETTIEVKEGLVIGRSEGELRLSDSKVSSRHACIQRDEAGVYYLQDLGSRNGIKHDGEKVSRIRLTPGCQFRIGRTDLVIEVDTDSPQPSKKQKRPEEPLLEHMLADLAKQVSDRTRPVMALPQPLQLNIHTGLQRGTEWILGYGPRQIGASTPEFTITEPGAPEICFTIRPADSDIIIDTSETDWVRINDQALSEKRLVTGDQVKIANTMIEFTLLEAGDDS